MLWLYRLGKEAETSHPAMVNGYGNNHKLYGVCGCTATACQDRVDGQDIRLYIYHHTNASAASCNVLKDEIFDFSILHLANVGR